MAKNTLVIVESPTKAKTIGKFLGKEFEVMASYGHVRDLPNNAAEIPAAVKKEKWSRLGINIEKDFEPLYIIPDQKKKRVKELQDAIKSASLILLATDEDREGESISWHLLEVLKPKVPTKRLVFHEITKSAIDEAIASPREIDENLVRAQETRRIIDRLFGYSLSPLLWKKMAPRLSAGRVQSVALRLLVERERERISFKSANYWDLKATFAKGSDPFDAELTHVGGKRVASGKDFEPTTGLLKKEADALHLTENTALSLRERLLKGTPKVSSVEEKPFTQKPYAPFTTSTLQQEGSRKLGFAAKRTMAVAQTLYENGFITYMRTDSTMLSQEALDGAKAVILKEFGDQFLSPEPRIYKTKVKNAQEAHEAIRPAGSEFVSPDVVLARLGQEAFKLYDLIWKRTLASQMKDAVGTRISVQIAIEDATFRAAGKTISFPGFLRAYVEGSDEPEADLEEMEKILPPLSKGDSLETKKLDALPHDTQAPPRYTEGSLIKELERLGIGRPSTWATIVDVVLSRTYAFKRGQALVPTFLAIAVVGLMEQYFTNLVDYEFTANMEDDLDAISRGERDGLKYLGDFYNGNGHPGLKPLVSSGEENIDPRIVCGIPIGEGAEGQKIEVRIGKYGPFLSDGESRASVPDDLAPDEVKVEKAAEILRLAKEGPASLGTLPDTTYPVYLKRGRFGPYIQLGDENTPEETRKMVSLLPGMEPEQVSLEVALKLLELPKSLGKHPETNEEIMVYNGRYGPYIKSGTETRTIPLDDYSVLDLSTEQAIEILKMPKRRGRVATQPKTMRDLGPHPETQKTLSIKSGRYGPYVTDGEINASLPRGADPNSISVQEAVELLSARAEKIKMSPPKPKRGAKVKSASTGAKGSKKKKKEEEAEEE